MKQLANDARGEGRGNIRDNGLSVPGRLVELDAPSIWGAHATATDKKEDAITPTRENQ